MCAYSVSNPKLLQKAKQKYKIIQCYFFITKPFSMKGEVFLPLPHHLPPTSSLLSCPRNIIIGNEA